MGAVIGRRPHLTMRPPHNVRVLAIDLRPQRFGYAVFEGKQLIDWGGKTFDSSRAAGERTASLLTLFHPAAIAVRRDRHYGLRRPGVMAAVLRSIRHEATKRSIPLHLITATDIEEAFRTFDTQNKDDIAFTLTTIFPELLSRLPPKRKKWEHEHHRMVVFDAVAVGFAYHWHNGTRAPPAD